MRARHFTNALAHTLVLALLALPALGTAAHAAVPASVPSGAALYTGPGESYAAAGELAADTAVYAIETEGDWTLIDFPRDGGRARAYAATQSLSMDGAVREANLLSVQATTAAAGTLYASPDENAGILAEPGIMTPVTILRMEGDFAFIEMDGSQGQRLRGWTPASTVGATGAAAFPCSARPNAGSMKRRRTMGIRCCSCPRERKLSATASCTTALPSLPAMAAPAILRRTN